MYIIVVHHYPKTPKTQKRVVHQKQKITKLKVRMRTFCFHFPKQNSEIDIPSRGPPPAKPPMVVVGDAHPNTMENQGLNNTSSAWLSITAKTRNPGCSRKSQNARSRSDIVFCVFTLMQCCAHSKTTNRLKQLYPHEGEVSPQKSGI